MENIKNVSKTSKKQSHKGRRHPLPSGGEAQRRRLVGPALAHLDGLLPAAETVVGLGLGDLGLEDCLTLDVDVLEVLECLPDTGGEASGDGGTEGCGLAHRRTVDVDADEVGLSLRREVKLVLMLLRPVLMVGGFVLSRLTCMMRSELHMPPSTASSVSFWPLSFSMESRIARVWKQVASSVARAMWPFCV